MINKHESLKKIRDLRVLTRYEGFFSIEDFFSSNIDGMHLSPFTKSSQNVDSDIVFILQDWASEDFINKGLNDEAIELGYDPNIMTNKNLINLLKEHFDKNLKDIYTTNLFPYIKKGGMNARIPSRFLKKSATDFIVPIINIIKPRLVVCFGLSVFNTIRQTHGLKNVPNIEQAVNSPFTHRNSIYFCQAHPGMLGKNNRNRNSTNKVHNDWNKMLKLYNQNLSI